MTGDLPLPFIALRDYLIENYNAKRASGGKECIIRCPFCGDSRDTSKAHMYIGVNKKHNNAISYNCFKCNSGGIVGLEFLKKLNIYDMTLINLVLDYNKSLGLQVNQSLYYRGGYRNKFSRINKVVIPVKHTEEYYRKIDYINRRLGCHLIPEDLPGFSIVINLMDFLSANGITTYSRHPNIVQELSLGFIGFLSIDSSHVTLRRIVPEDKVHESIRSRYINYTINEKGVGFYGIRESIDVIKNNMICIAEGPFDALSIHVNLMPLTLNKVIFASNGKEGLMNVLRYLVWNKGLGLINTTIHIYLDNDLSQLDIQSYRNILTSMDLSYVFHRNTFPGEKDYGVSYDKIVDTIVESRLPLM